MADAPSRAASARRGSTPVLTSRRAPSVRPREARRPASLRSSRSTARSQTARGCVSPGVTPSTRPSAPSVTIALPTARHAVFPRAPPAASSTCTPTRRARRRSRWCTSLTRSSTSRACPANRPRTLLATAASSVRCTAEARVRRAVRGPDLSRRSPPLRLQRRRAEDSFYDKRMGPCSLHTVVRGEAYYETAEIPAAEFVEGTPTYP